MTNILGLTDKDFVKFKELQIKANSLQLRVMGDSCYRERRARTAMRMCEII